MRKGEWVLHEEIVNELLKNPEILRVLKTKSEWRLLSGDKSTKEVVSNIVAWFSQKITEYEKGDLSNAYSQFYLIQEAYAIFDRAKIGGNYAYKTEFTPELSFKVEERKRQKIEELEEFSKELRKVLRMSKQKLVDRQVEEIRRKDEFKEFAEMLKRKKVPPDVYRKLIMMPLEEGKKLFDEWERQAERTRSKDKV